MVWLWEPLWRTLLVEVIWRTTSPLGVRFDTDRSPNPPLIDVMYKHNLEPTVSWKLKIVSILCPRCWRLRISLSELKFRFGHS
jgi:hypothetical protein